MDKEIVIDNFEWHTIHKAEKEQISIFRQKIKEGKNIAIMSEAGCPGVADPGQILVFEAQKMSAEIKPLVGPSSILLALMASGLNGQNFSFLGYLPIDNMERIKTTQLCIAAELTSGNQRIHTKSIAEWKKEPIDLNKKPVIYLFAALPSPK